MEMTYKHIQAECTRQGVSFIGYIENPPKTTTEQSRYHFYFTISNEVYCDICRNKTEKEADEECIRIALEVRKFNRDEISIVGL